MNINNVSLFKNINNSGKIKQSKQNQIKFKGILDKDIVEINGSQTKAKVYTSNLNYQTCEQIKTICSHPVFCDMPIRIMPDTHASVNTVVGFTSPINPRGEVIPNIISGDIGCGMLCVKIDTKGKNIDYDKLDKVIEKYVSTKRKSSPKIKDKSLEIQKKATELCKSKYGASPSKATESLGTLGGGNHFIELDRDDNGDEYLVIHSGSRHFGKEVCNHYQQIAMEQNPYRIKNLSYLSGDEAKEYLKDMEFTIRYSEANRRIIADEILRQMGWKELDSFSSIHNYIGKDGIIRKGSISATDGEKILIPLNMRDGSIIAIGKGNVDWNNSAPHGAGRQFSRSEANELITIEDVKKAMNGIHSNCVAKHNITESPDAYKPADEIAKYIGDTADIDTIIRPIYNYKD